ncbi:MAG: hypothetical protein LBB51_05680, partial [Zoogloeaceae bacterium]|nr:hypothetical protein [Zoogloeaceae bacterium]
MSHIFRIKPVAGALALAFASFPLVLHAEEAEKTHQHEHENHGATPVKNSVDEDEVELEPLVITAPFMNTPLEVRFDPKAPQQPLPANDGASFLKTIPGMSVIRKGGTDGDPVFRGMAASRLNILFDGEQILGGCGGRMDP